MNISGIKNNVYRTKMMICQCFRLISRHVWKSSKNLNETDNQNNGFGSN